METLLYVFVGLVVSIILIGVICFLFNESKVKNDNGESLLYIELIGFFITIIVYIYGVFILLKAIGKFVVRLF